MIFTKRARQVNLHTRPRVVMAMKVVQVTQVATLHKVMVISKILTVNPYKTSTSPNRQSLN